MLIISRSPVLGLLAVLIAAPAIAQLPDLEFDPAVPMPGDTVSVHVQTAQTSCPLLSTAAEREGSVITVSYVEGCTCLPGLPAPLEFTEEIGALPAGRYVVQLELSRSDHAGELCQEAMVVGEEELVVSGEELMLHDGRFVATATWRAFDGSSGVGRGVALSEQSGYFWFFHPTNVELTVKVLNACPLNGHFWVFTAAASNVEYEIEILDVADDSIESWTETNPLGNLPSLRADTLAFPTCP